MNKYIDLDDRHGNKIHVGNMVKFIVTYTFDEPPIAIYDSKDGTEMIDRVEEHNGKFYFVDPELGWRSLASVHNEKCTVL